MKLHSQIITGIIMSTALFGFNYPSLAASSDTTASSEQNQSTRDITETIKSKSSLSKFSKQAQKTGLDKTLKGKGPYTVFVPSNKAFSKLTQEQKNELANPEKLKKVLSHHVVAHKSLATHNMNEKMNVPSMAEEYLVLETSKDGKKIVGGALIKEEDIKCKNGVVHVIDEVLFPGEPASKEASGLDKTKSESSSSIKESHTQKSESSTSVNESDAAKNTENTVKSSDSNSTSQESTDSMNESK